MYEKMQWRPQDVGDARTVECELRTAAGSEQLAQEGGHDGVTGDV